MDATNGNLGGPRMRTTPPEKLRTLSPARPASARPTLSVVMPAYNEEEAIEAAVRDIWEGVLPYVPDSELIVVNDGSLDRTGEILDELAATDCRLRVIHKPNGGHGPALRTGLDASLGAFVFVLDSDRQIPLTAFPALWEAARFRDAAFGVRTDRQDARVRVALTAFIRLTLRGLFGASIPDANVPFKILRASAWAAARPFIPADSLAPSLFLAVFLVGSGYDVAQVRVPHLARETGTVSIRRWKLLKFCARGLGQLLALRARLRRSNGAVLPALR